MALLLGASVLTEGLNDQAEAVAGVSAHPRPPSSPCLCRTGCGETKTHSSNPKKIPWYHSFQLEEPKTSRVEHEEAWCTAQGMWGLWSVAGSSISRPHLMATPQLGFQEQKNLSHNQGIPQPQIRKTKTNTRPGYWSPWGQVDRPP